MKNSILYINACVRQESRTRKLADKLLEKLNLPYEEICLKDIRFPVVDEEYISKRNRLVLNGDFNNPMFDFARQFSEAETIVIAAPYWDLSFPASLKQYLELINVIGITFEYSKEGTPIGRCNAKRLFYVTTAGGCFVPEDYGFGYVKALAQNFYGIKDVKKFEATGLDIVGADMDAIMKNAEALVEGMEL